MINLGFRRWTRHSLVLVVAGTIYIAVGIAFIIAPQEVRNGPSLQFAVHLMSLTKWGAVFIVVGVLSAFSATWPMGVEKWGYTVLTGLSAGWSAIYVIPVIFGRAPRTGVVSSLVWGMLAFIWWAVSGLISPEYVTVVMEDGTD